MFVPRLHGIACKAACDAYKHGELGDTFLEEEITDAQVCIGLREAHKSLVVAFRGTSTWTDWTYNLDVRMVNSDSCRGRVHSGFKRQWLSIRKAVIDHMDTYDEAKYDDILVTGHSLGSGIGSIAAVEIATLFESKRVHLITFGAPRYGDKTFVKESIMKLADVARYVCGYDPIPFIPVMFSSYGVYWHLHNGNLVRKLDSFGALARLKSIFCSADHRSQRYLINLVEHLEQ